MVYIRPADDFGEAMLVVAIMAVFAVVYGALRTAGGLARLLGSA
jgi:small neutral amino acid transporter SnatA (MarC family)